MQMDKPREACGIFGVFAREEMEVSRIMYYGLYALQHRGQESAGIATSTDGEIVCHKGMGLVSEVFDHGSFEKLSGRMAIGHVRYSTTGESVPENAQPLVTRYAAGKMALAHNGNLTNAEALAKELIQSGAVFQTTTDSEIIAFIIAKEYAAGSSIEQAITRAIQRLRGAYSLLILLEDKLIALRDPWGFRPLCVGELNGSTIVASESCALDTVGATFVRDVQPGEIVIIDEKGMSAHQVQTNCRSSLCVFEYIYFARPDSVIDGVSVYEARLEAGRLLARQAPVDADAVIGVPESGIDAAVGYAQESGIPYAVGFVKNAYVGRTFIRPQQDQRETGVRIKLNPLKESVQGKRIVMIDDSIVRGTTSARIIRLLRQAGAKEVHMRVSSPSFLHPCYYGTDVGTHKELTAHGNPLEALRKKIDADSLAFLDVNSLSSMLGGRKVFCNACFTGKYPVRSEKEAQE
ncbi:MAG: amidophosphoribosyltransferase [Bacillota bacterium]